MPHLRATLVKFFADRVLDAFPLDNCGSSRGVACERPAAVAVTHSVGNGGDCVVVWLHTDVMDAYVDRRNRVFIVDFNVFGADTDPKLFAWHELIAASKALASAAASTPPTHGAGAASEASSGASAPVAAAGAGAGAAAGAGAGAGAGSGATSADAGRAGEGTTAGEAANGTASPSADVSAPASSAAGDDGGAGSGDGPPALPEMRVVMDERGVLFGELAHHGLPQDLLDVDLRDPEALARLQQATAEQQRMGERL